VPHQKVFFDMKNVFCTGIGIYRVRYIWRRLEWRYERGVNKRYFILPADSNSFNRVRLLYQCVGMRAKIVGKYDNFIFPLPKEGMEQSNLSIGCVTDRKKQIK